MLKICIAICRYCRSSSVAMLAITFNIFVKTGRYPWLIAIKGKLQGGGMIRKLPIRIYLHMTVFFVKRSIGVHNTYQVTSETSDSNL